MNARHIWVRKDDSAFNGHTFWNLRCADIDRTKTLVITLDEDEGLTDEVYQKHLDVMTRASTQSPLELLFTILKSSKQDELLAVVNNYLRYDKVRFEFFRANATGLYRVCVRQWSESCHRMLIRSGNSPIGNFGVPPSTLVQDEV